MLSFNDRARLSQKPTMLVVQDFLAKKPCCRGSRNSEVSLSSSSFIMRSKIFITNGGSADLIVVAAKTDQSAGAKGISLVLLDTKNA